MKILLNNDDLNEALKNVSKLGFVPTMGGLHKGHISLIKQSKNQCKETIVSIFVNPTQFNDKRDFLKYPRNTKKDLSILKKLKVNFVYMPKSKDIYNFDRKIKIAKKDMILCAKFRKGHFEGVIDVMDRLTKKIKPQKIFMGEKDYQQLYLVKNYLKKKSNAKIVSCKTIRDNFGLALSSRNLHLNNQELITARYISRDLSSFKKKLVNSKKISQLISSKIKEYNNLKDIKIEYLEVRNRFNLKKSLKIKNSKIFIAYFLRKVRLIDNL